MLFPAGDLDSAPVPLPEGRWKRKRAVRKEGPRTLFLIFGKSDGWWSKTFSHGDGANVDPATRLVCVALSSWRLVSRNDETSHESEVRMRDAAEKLLGRYAPRCCDSCRLEFASFLCHVEVAHFGSLLCIYRQGSADSEVECALASVSVTRTGQVFAREGLGSDSGCQAGVPFSLCRSFFVSWVVKLQKWEMVVTVIVHNLNKANMFIVGRKGGRYMWPTITR